ncbi:MAG: hypothetical protein PVJ67_07015 [Candidatus Pacearchaeota archaeon]|jgi:hypothetical protein
MVNQSKVNDPRFWKKWRDSGAVGTIESAYDNAVKREKREFRDALEKRIQERGSQAYGFFGLTDFTNPTEITNPDWFPYAGKIEEAPVRDSYHQARYTTPDGKLQIYGSDCSMNPVDSLRVVVQGLVAKGYDKIPLKKVA